MGKRGFFVVGGGGFVFLFFLVNTGEITVSMVCFQGPLILLTISWRTLMSEISISHIDPLLGLRLW